MKDTRTRTIKNEMRFIKKTLVRVPKANAKEDEA